MKRHEVTDEPWELVKPLIPERQAKTGRPATETIWVRGGKIQWSRGGDLFQNLAAHRLYLRDLRWELVRERELRRQFVLNAHARGFPSPPADAFRPRSIDHQWVESDAVHLIVYQIDVRGARVRFELWEFTVEMLIEGELPAEIVDRLVAQIVENLCESTECVWTAKEEPVAEESGQSL